MTSQHGLQPDPLTYLEMTAEKRAEIEGLFDELMLINPRSVDWLKHHCAYSEAWFLAWAVRDLIQNYRRVESEKRVAANLANKAAIAAFRRVHGRHALIRK